MAAVLKRAPTPMEATSAHVPLGIGLSLMSPALISMNASPTMETARKFAVTPMGATIVHVTLVTNL